MRPAYKPAERPSGEAELFFHYAAAVSEKVEAAWTKPYYSGRRPLTVKLQLELGRSGRLNRVAVVEPSGYRALDRSAIEAVKSAGPYPPIPDGTELDPVSLFVEMVLTAD